MGDDNKKAAAASNGHEGLVPSPATSQKFEELKAERRAALNLMEDAVLAKRRADDLVEKLRTEVEARMRAETELRASEERHAFLLTLSDALRLEPSADAVANRALQMLYDKLGLDRCYIGVYRPEDDRGDFTHQVGNDRVPPLPGGVRLSDFPEALRVALDGTLVIEDVAEAEGLTDADRRNLGGLSLRALVAATLRKGEKNPLWSIVAVSAAPRRWTRGEIALIEEVTERTWAAIERVRAEVALREAEESKRLIIESAEDYAIFTVDLERRVNSWNSGAQSVFGWADDEIIGEIGDIIFTPEDRATGRPTWEAGKALKDGRAVNERWHMRKDGSRFWGSGITHPMHDRNGQPLGFVKIMRDLTEQRQNEEALLRAHERIVEVLESTADAFYSLDAEFNFTYVNQRAAQFWGREADSLIGKHYWTEFPTIVGSEPYRKHYEVLDTGDSAHFETISPVTGNWVDASIYPASEGGLSVFFRDITDRKRAEASAREFDRRLRVATEASHLGVWEWNLDTNLVAWNAHHYRLMGMEPGSGTVEAPEFFGRVHRDDREHLEEEIRQAVREARVFDAVYRVVHDTGAVRWMSGYGRLTDSVDGRPMTMSGVMMDITDRMQMEEDLRISNERMRLLMESATDCSIFTTDRRGIVNSWNSGAARIYGFADHEIIGQDVAILYTDEDRERGDHLREMEEAVQNGRALDERWHKRKDGTTFFASGLTQPIGEGGAEGFVKIARDMTERLRAEKARREKELMQTLVNAQELERRRIARDLHDELGQQLTALRLKLDRVSDAAPELIEGQISEVKDIAKNIDEGVDFLAWELRPAALDDLGLVPALEKFAREWSGYSGVAAQVTATNSAERRFGAELETALYRIVQEALNNIHKHAKANNAGIAVRTRRGKVVLIVEDDGTGFDSDDPVARSRGMGLIGMMERLQMIGGTLEIESERGRGTTLYVKAPVA